MKKAKKTTKKKTESAGRFEAQLFKAADKLRKSIDAAEYKHVVLGLIFLKFISDAFDVHYQKLASGKGEYEGANPEDQDEYKAENVFWVPPEARWAYLHSRAKLPSVGKDLDAAMEAIERANPTLKGILPKEYAKPNLDKVALGGLVDLIADVALGEESEKSKDLIGRVYEYFLGEFASLEGKKGGQFYTPRSIVELMVEMIEPLSGRVYDPACGSGGMFVMSEKFVLAHRGRLEDISIYGQESNHTTYRLCRMNLALRGIDGSQVIWNSEGSFLKDAHPDLKADYILANPPFNQSDWGWDILKNDARWKYGLPPEGNANYAWLQHMIHHLSPKGVMATVLSNGSLSSNQGGEGELRKKLVDEDMVDCIVALPNQLFYNTGIPACLWFISRKRLGNGDRKRTGEVLFIDASQMGSLVDRTHREFTEEDIKKIAGTYHEWRQKNNKYKDIKGFCKSASLAEVQKNGYVLTAGRYVGIADGAKDSEPFEEKMTRLTGTFKEQMEQEQTLNEEIKKQLKKVGFEL